MGSKERKNVCNKAIERMEKKYNILSTNVGLQHPNKVFGSIIMIKNESIPKELQNLSNIPYHDCLPDGYGLSFVCGRLGCKTSDPLLKAKRTVEEKYPELNLYSNKVVNKLYVKAISKAIHKVLQVSYGETLEFMDQKYGDHKNKSGTQVLFEEYLTKALEKDVSKLREKTLLKENKESSQEVCEEEEEEKEL